MQAVAGEVPVRTWIFISERFACLSGRLMVELGILGYCSASPCAKTAAELCFEQGPKLAEFAQCGDSRLRLSYRARARRLAQSFRRDVACNVSSMGRTPQRRPRI